MSMVQKLQKRVEFKIPTVWDSTRKDIKTEAKSNAAIVVQKLLESADLKPGDDMTVDVRILVERNE